jgi:hypothetical protein
MTSQIAHPLSLAVNGRNYSWPFVNNRYHML